MMDPLSITASTAALVGLIDQAVRGVRKLARLKDGVPLLQQLNNELSDLRLVVGKVEALCRQALVRNSNPVSDQEVISRAINQAKDSILELEKVIAYGLLAPSLGPTVKIDRLFWIRKESEIKDRRDRLRDAKWNLSIAIGLDQMESQTTTQLHLVELQASNQLILSRQQMLENIIDLRLPQPERPALLLTGASDRLENNLQQSTTTRLESSIEADPSLTQAIIFRTVSSKPCGPFCSCVCHKIKQFRSPSLLDRLVGSFFIGYEALPLITKSCNSSHCGRGNATRTVVSYMFPRWFLNCKVMLETRPPTPEPVIRILRIRQNDSEIFKALKSGDISRTRRMMVDGTASVRDVNEEGESLITIALTSAINYSSSYFAELTHLGVDMFQLDNRSLSGYLYFWHPTLVDSQFRPKSQLDIFGSEPEVDHFQFTQLHAAVLGLGTDSATPEEVICTTSRELINDLDQLGRTALSWACAKGDLCKIRKLLEMGADPNIADSEGRTSLHLLAHNRHLAQSAVSANERCLDELLNHGADVNVRNRRGGTPLHDFTCNLTCTASSIEKLYLKSANLNAQDGSGWAPINWAVRYGNIEVIDKLIKHRADLEIQSEKGITPLTYALVRHQFGTFKYLLELGCHYDVRTRSGSTVLHLSARDGDIDTLRYLEQWDLRGINPDDIDEDGLTALERAERRRDGVYEWVDLVRNEALPDAEPQTWFEAFLALNQKLKTTQREV